MALSEGNESLIPLFPTEQNEWQIKLRQVQVCGAVANVDLYNDSGGINDEAALVRARTAIANTMIDYLGVEQVNVFFNGQAVNYQGFALGAMERYEAGPETYLNQLRQLSEKPAFPINLVVTLYFPDKSGEKLLCETREIQVAEASELLPDALARKILYELIIKGSRNAEHTQAIVKNVSPLTGYSVEVAHTLSLSGDVDLPDTPEDATQSDEGAGEMQGGSWMPQAYKTLRIEIMGEADLSNISRKAVVNSIMSVLADQELTEIKVAFSGEKMEEVPGLMREDGFGVNGTLVEVCLPKKNQTGLQKQSLSLFCKQSEDPASILQALRMNGEQNALFDPVFPENSHETDILGAYVSGETAVVNISASLHDRLEQSGEREQGNFIFGVIGTMVQIPQIKNVQFLVDGEVRESLGPYVIGGTLMPDWGRMP